MGTLVASRYHPEIREMYQRLLIAGKPKMGLTRFDGHPR
jgi:hypothetical protein